MKTDLWFGTEDSLLLVLEAEKRLATLEAQGEPAIRAKIAEMWAGRGTAPSADPFSMPPMWQNQDGVAVMDISGPLIQGHAGFMRLFGVTGYGDIQASLAEVAADKDVKAALLMIDSTGGAVNGVEDTGNSIRSLASMKPVVSFSDGGMLSAAYWLGASADRVLSSKTAQVGSVGTLMVHTEVTEALKAEGITKTVIRFGDFKALGNPFEKLSEAGRAEMQAMADEAGQIFVDYVADRRGVTPAQFQKTMGEGRVFMGRKANEVGLTDGVMSLADAMSMMKNLDKVKTPQQNAPKRGNSAMAKATLASALVLSLIGGTKVEGLDLKAANATAEGTEPDADAQTALSAQAQEVAAAVEASKVAAVEAAIAPLTAQVEAAKTELEATKAEVALVRAATQTLTAERDVAMELADAMSVVLRNSIAVMSVALQGPKDAGKDLTGQALLDEHSRLATQFKNKFPAGGIAAVGVAVEGEHRDTQRVEPDPLFIHAVHSLQRSRK